VPPGQVPREWLNIRSATSAELAGAYCAVIDSRSIAALYPYSIGMALSIGLPDFDAAALKDARPRELIRAIAARTTDSDARTFTSRHGDDLQLWAIFERPDDGLVSPRLRHRRSEDLYHAFHMLGLTWTSD
jgi:hypothetical protein